MFSDLSPALPLVRDGKLRALGVTSATRVRDRERDSDARRSGRAGLRGGGLADGRDARRHAARHSQQAARRDESDPGRARGSRADRAVRHDPAGPVRRRRICTATSPLRPPVGARSCSRPARRSNRDGSRRMMMLCGRRHSLCGAASSYGCMSARHPPLIAEYGEPLMAEVDKNARFSSAGRRTTTPPSLAFSNRHGLSRRDRHRQTVTLQVLAEGFSRAGVRFSRPTSKAICRASPWRARRRRRWSRAGRLGSTLSPTTSRWCSGTCSASRAIRSGPPFRKSGHCCCRA